MLRTISSCERILHTAPPNVVTVEADTATEIFPDETLTRGEIVTRWLQNLGEDDLYISFGLADGTGGPLCDDALLYDGVIVGK